MKLPDDIMKDAKTARDRDELKQILNERKIDLTEDELIELTWQLGIPHGSGCPCCSSLLWRYQLTYKKGGR